MKSVLKLIRPHQYLKNGFVFLGPLFAHHWDLVTLSSAIIAFFSFCCIASSVYVLNDIVDVDADRAHPVKRARPLPSGGVSIAFAKGLLVALILVATSLALTVGAWAACFVLVYFLINVLYSLRLKHVVILDVFIISSGFMLRILTGTVGLGIAPSSWLLLCGLMVTLFLGFGKRRAELLMLESCGGDRALTRKVLDDYSPQMLEQFIAVTAACTIMAYGLYTVSPQTISLHGSDNLVYTVPLVVYGMFRYLFLLHRQSKGNDTAKDLVQDSHLLITVLAWVSTTLWILA
ncbi:decaprenyl-phosphate phosphoribosyltransferase [Marinobacter xestospongiae]|uniref:Decaprenyl-phosphate phosphoribosyltransferase n=1 Tax=Marinobacter xestospongiae TaxID=994319 RepID=A0ABU3VS72_9GAMM|nr:decaprenyl-phosphate phosphoribosyltransferase [Marinobacter xestospongiae]MDV2077041.1 decaprenyl-phosphate phosphoribosyltransferase [Marinobacter xestospongiae]